MAPRALWKGYLRLSLVSIAVELFNAVDTRSEISFRQIHKPSGRRVNYTKTVQGVGEIQSSDIVKGFEIDQDTYVIMEPEEIEAVKLESKKTIDLVSFVDAKDIDYRFFERPYFVTPADKFAAEGYVVIREALAKTGKVGLSQVTMHGREYLGAVAPLGKGLVFEILRYSNELRDPEEFFGDLPAAKPDKEMVSLGMELIQRKTTQFKPEKFEDHYAEAIKALIEKKRKGQKIIAPAAEQSPRATNVIDLMDALKKSIGSSTAKPPAKKRKSAS